MLLCGAVCFNASGSNDFVSRRSLIITWQCLLCYISASMNINSFNNYGPVTT